MQCNILTPKNVIVVTIIMASLLVFLIGKHLEAHPHLASVFVTESSILACTVESKCKKNGTVMTASINRLDNRIVAYSKLAETVQVEAEWQSPKLDRYKRVLGWTTQIAAHKQILRIITGLQLRRLELSTYRDAVHQSSTHVVANNK
jgi:hypothetical protein